MTPKNNMLDTYRFLRLGLVALGALLLTSVIWQIGDAGCYQASISAFYHTPVHNVFVAALCAVGASMIIYQGDSPIEDVTLNLTGAAAFVIALVPASVDGHHCMSAAVRTSDTDINHGVVNNLFALFIVGVLAVVIARIVNPETFDFSGWKWWEKAWLAVTSLYMAVGAVIFIVERDDFRGRTHAHLVAAATLFVGLIIVTIANAVIQWKIKQAKDGTRTYVLLYSVLAGVMVVQRRRPAHRPLDPG